MVLTEDLNSILIPLEGEVTMIHVYETLRAIRYYQSKRQIDINSITRKLTRNGRELRRNSEAMHEDEKFLEELKEKNAALHKQLKEGKKRREEEKNKSKPIAFEINFNESKLDDTANSSAMYTTCYSFPETPATFKKVKRRSRSLTRMVKLFKAVSIITIAENLFMASLFDFLQVNKHKTFRPKKKFPQGTLRYQLHKQAEATLRSGIDLRNAVRLPPNENMDDWLAVHTVDFFNRINLMYGAISDVCTKKSCPTMSGGPKYEYLWQDGETFKKPTRLPAPDYMHHLMDWIESKINDENVFPASMAVPFPKDFKQVCKKILTRLFRVFVHIYIHHFERLTELGAEPHANTLYKHFYYFVVEYNMVSPKELEALKEMTERLLDCGQKRFK